MIKKIDAKIIDFHSHILPCADHGSDGIETSLKQLEFMAKIGVDIAVATPHFYPQKETVEQFLEKRERAVKLLSEAKSDDVKVAVGAEVYAVAGLEKLDGLEKLTIKGTNTLLLEMPMSYWNTNIIDTVLELDNRFDIILAHIDRYPTSNVSKLVDLGIAAQINTSHITKHHNFKRLKEWLGEDAVWALGSDIHGKDSKACKSFKKCCKKLKYDIEDIFRHTEQLIKGAELI